MYALIENGIVIEYPYGVHLYRMTHPLVSLPAEPTAEQLAEVGVIFVQSTVRPADDLGIIVTEDSPLLINDIWMQQWITRVATAQEQAQQVADIQASIVSSTQDRLDAFARTRNYDGILSACTYATSTIPKFAAEGQYAVNARDNTWATLYTIMGEVQAGTRTMPSNFANVEPLLPALVWPV